MTDDVLVVIPARGGSKGIPYKNIKSLGGKPLIYYSIDVAREFTNDENICVTTDDDKIIDVVEQHDLHVSFKRAANLATDTCGSSEVIVDAYSYYAKHVKTYRAILLLQPTSPFRKVEFLNEAVKLYDNTIDMVTSVKLSDCNPYYDCFEETSDGFLHVSKGDGNIKRRQDAPPTWQQNGSIYVINPASLMVESMSKFTKIRKYIMSVMYSIDIDTIDDWTLAEDIINHGLVD